MNREKKATIKKKKRTIKTKDPSLTHLSVERSFVLSSYFEKLSIYFEKEDTVC